MKCEKCGMTAQWRSTNTITNMVKYKCPNCSNVFVVPKVDEVVHNYELTAYEKMLENKSKPTHIRVTRQGTYNIRKYNSNKKYEESFGTYKDRSIAEAVVNKLEEVGWDKNNLYDIYTELGIRKEGRHWVWT